MNINLIYHNSSFNFDLRKDISIQYLEDLTSKLINKDKSSFDLIYKDITLTENSKSLLKDIVQTDENISIKITPKLTMTQLKEKNILPKLKTFNHSNVNYTESNVTNNNILLSNESELSQSFSDHSIKVLQKLTKHNTLNKRKKNLKTEYITQNIVFEEIYNLKENELLSLLKNFTEKIKEYDDILYKKCKNSFNKSNSELLLYEKNVMDFKDKQIKFIKKLLHYFDNKETDFLDDFYNEIKQYDNSEIILNYKSKISKLESKLLSPLISIEKNYSNSNKELPLLLNNNINNKLRNKLYLSQKRAPNDITINEMEKEQKSLFYNENEKKKNKIIPKRNSINTYESIHIEEQNNTTNNKNTNNKKLKKKNSITNTTKANTNQSENSTNSKVQEKAYNIPNTIIPKQLNTNKNSNNNENNKNSNDDINSKNNNNFNNEKKNKIDNKLKLMRNKKRSETYKRVNSIENIKYNRNKVSTLFEISESYVNENLDSDRYSNSSEKNISEDKNTKEMNYNNQKKSNYNLFFHNSEDINNLKINLNKKKKSMNYSVIKNSKIGYLVKAKNRKINQRIKKLGNNVNDFLI